MLAAPATAAVARPPAVDQYTQHLPTAGGTSTAGEEAPVAHPEQLPSKTQAALSGPEGQVLAQIATAPSLGAPTPTDSAKPRPAAVSTAGAGTGASVDSRSLGTVVTDTAGTGPSLFLIGALAGIAVAGAWRFFRRRGSSSQAS
jgi:hypothetical protein